jgi:hypothetical protein
LNFEGHELFLAIAIEAPREVVLVRSKHDELEPQPQWTYLALGQKRYRLKATRDPDVWRCDGLSHAAFHEALKVEPNLKISIQ